MAMFQSTPDVIRRAEIRQRIEVADYPIPKERSGDAGKGNSVYLSLSIQLHSPAGVGKSVK
jgi:hypothetical protein